MTSLFLNLFKTTTAVISVSKYGLCCRPDEGIDAGVGVNQLINELDKCHLMLTTA